MSFRTCFHSRIVLEWFSLGTFIIAGDMITQKIEHNYSCPKVCSNKASEHYEAVEMSSAVLHSSSENQDSGCSKHVHSMMVKAMAVEKPFQFDKSRVIAAACIGLLWVSPICMAWYPFLHRLMRSRFSHLREGSAKYVSVKVALENICLAVPMCLGYFAIPALIEGSENWYEELKSRLERDFCSTLGVDVSYWLVVSPLNYKYVPVKYQAALCCLLGGVEAAGLSFYVHREKE